MSYTEDLHTGFIADEVMLKLIRDIPQENYEEKLELIEAEKERVEGTFDAAALNIRYHNERGFAYWQAEKLEEALEEFGEAQQALPPADYPSFYMGLLRFLISINRRLGNFEDAQTWVDAAVAHLAETESSFDRLSILEEYVLLLGDTEAAFDAQYQPLIDTAKTELDFQIQLSGNAVADVNTMRELHLEWNQRFGRIMVDHDKLSKQGLISRMQQYKNECPIGWYQAHAQDQIDRLNGV